MQVYIRMPDDTKEIEDKLMTILAKHAVEVYPKEDLEAMVDAYDKKLIH